MPTLLRRHGVAIPLAEHVVHDDARFVGRVDFAYPELRLAIEVHGFEAHTGLEVFRSDRARQNDLVGLGWDVLRYTWADVNRQAWHVAHGVDRARRQLLDRLEAG